MFRQNLIVFLILTAIGFFAYKDCLNIFIPADNYSQLFTYSKGFVSGMNENIHNGSPYFVTFPLLYLLYQLFGASPVCWVITSTLLHVVTSFVIFLIARKLIGLFFHKQETVIAFFSALVFLISPYQTENVLWAPLCLRTLHALVTFAGFYFFILYLSNPSLKKLIGIHLLFVIGIFSYEFTLICPLIYVVLYMLFKMTNKTPVSIKHFFTQTITVQLFFIVIYFIACKILSGHWLWHSGTMETFAQSTNYPKTFLKYLAKFFVFYRYLPFENSDSLLREFFNNYFKSGLLLITLIVFFLYIFTKVVKRNKEIGYFLLAMFTCFTISLLPVLPLDSSFLKYIYPDRYGYMASAFFYVFLVSSLFFFLKKLAFPVVIGYSVLSWLLLMQTTAVWNSANEYCNKLIQNFKPFLQYDNVFVLNTPAYYKGVVAFRSGFPESIYLLYDKYTQEKIQVISGTYQESWMDTLRSVKISGNTIEVVGPEKHTPHFCTDGWARSYETKEYKVVFDPTGCSYRLTFKQDIPLNSAFIYTSNGIWKKAE